jgi:methylthioribose-1-phosphate isomerase
MFEKCLPPIYWDGDAVAILDQRVLPHQEKILLCSKPQQVITAIKNMSIRGAPAVGVAGALALALGARDLQAADTQTFRRKFVRLCEQVKNARPTGNNLGWAVEKVYSVLLENPRADVPELQALIRRKADDILAEDVRDNVAIGKWGKEVIPSGARVLTYCNAGALATADYGTAVGVIRAAFADDPTLEVYACETRPFLQGARLTAYELQCAGIPVTLITDNAAGSLMQQGKIDVVVVGADRIASNGDTANKIGTYTVAVLARTHNIPFYVAAPRSTIDPSLADGSGIPIEQRDPREVTHLFGRPVAPKDIKALNPAFDVTPSKYITGIITEVGVLQKPFKQSIRKALEA